MEKLWCRVKKIFRVFLDEIREPYFVGMPAQLAFYLFLSITPSMVLISQLLGMFDLTLEEVELWMNIDINSETMQTIASLLEGGKPSGMNSVVFAFVAIWGGSRAQFSMAKITNRINTQGETAGRIYIKDRIIAIGSMIVLLLSLVAAVVGLVYLPALVELAIGEGFWGKILSMIWVKIRWLIVASLFFFSLVYVYCMTPRIRPKPSEAIPGALFALLGMMVMTGIFNLYVKYSMSRNIIYGSLSSIVGLLMWFWSVSWVLSLGGIFNKAWKVSGK